MADKTYITVQSDTWDSIAYRLWGEERHLVALWAANPQYADTLVFPAGVELMVPEQPARRVDQKELPPWLK